MIARSTLRLLIALGAVAMLGVGVVQAYWFEKAFDVRKQQFETRVELALTAVAGQLLEAAPQEGDEPGALKAVEQRSAGGFVAMVNRRIDPATLDGLLAQEFDRRGVALDYEYGVYDCQTQKMQYGRYVCATGDCQPGSYEAAASGLPDRAENDHYFAVYFPEAGSGLPDSMEIWLFSSAVLLATMLFFAYALYVIFRQKRLSEIQTDFVNNMAHEFKTPLATMDISSRVLMEPAIVESPDRLLRYAAIVNGEARRLKGQVERVLQMATPLQRLDLKREPIELSKFLSEIVARQNAALQEKGFAIQTDIAEPLRVEGDGLHLANLVSNLLDNAVKYSPGLPEITLSLRREGRFAVLTVADKGLGIDDKHAKLIFDKFYRVPTGDVHDVKGFGLGLHYVRTVAEAHRGGVRLSSAPGEGSAFGVRLPLAEK